MSRNDRRAAMYLIFLEQFYNEGHFKQNAEVMDAVKVLKEDYASGKPATTGEYLALLRAKNRIANSVRGNEVSLEMMLEFTSSVCCSYTAHSGGKRRAAWHSLYKAVSGLDEYKALLNRVPTQKDEQAVTFAAELSEMFEHVMKDEGVI